MSPFLISKLKNKKRRYNKMKKERISVESFNVFWETVILLKREDLNKKDKGEIWKKVRTLPLDEAIDILFSLADAGRE